MVVAAGWGRFYCPLSALESGRTSWVALLDAVRLRPADDATLVTATQLRGVVERLTQAGHWRPGDPEILSVMDSGYDVSYLSHALADLPVALVGRLRSDRGMLRDAGTARPGPKDGRPRRHGGVLTFAKPDSWHQPDVTTATDTTHYGRVETMAWDRMHPRSTHRGPWLDHADYELPLLHGTLMRLKAERLPGNRDPKPVWLWWLCHRRDAGGGGPLVAVVPLQIRSRAHLQAPEADARLDGPESPPRRQR